jgi:PIN domain nuclease of toxin-antitoxin system
MIYVVDTHILIWFLDGNKRLNPKHKKILLNPDNSFLISTIVLAEIKHLVSIKRIKVDFNTVIRFLGECDNCIIYPVDEAVIGHMPNGLNIHDALIVGTGLVYRDAFDEKVHILTEDGEIKQANLLPVP